MKTAVEWFNEQIKLNAEFREIFKGRVSFIIGLSKIDELLKQAKEMEKEQIVESFSLGIISHHDAFKNQNKWNNGEQYYNETFKSEIINCKHENELMRQGDGFVYVVCEDCGINL